MESVTFALPNTADMSKDEQVALIVNQATAVIVAAWLEYAPKVLPMADADNSVNEGYYYVDRRQIGDLIDSVQDALKSL